MKIAFHKEKQKEGSFVSSFIQFLKREGVPFLNVVSICWEFSKCYPQERKELLFLLKG